MGQDEQQIADAGRDAGTDQQQRIDEASGMRAGPPGTGELDEDAVVKGDERWEQARASH